MKKTILILLSASLLLTSLTVVSADTQTDPTSGLKFKSTMVGKDEETDITLHETYFSPYENHSLASPAIFSDYTEPVSETVSDADFYVSVSGNDETGNGSADLPFATLERARDAVRELKEKGDHSGSITVAVMAGTYQISETLSFNSEDSGTAESPIIYTAYGDGEVIFKGSVSLDPNDFVPVNDGIKSRLSDGVGDAVRMIDLKEYGISPEMLKYNQTSTTTGGGTNVEISVDRKGFTLARYPNADWVYSESSDMSSNKATLKLSEELNDRVKSWSTTEGIFGITKPQSEYDDASSELVFNTDNRTVTFSGFRLSRNELNMPFYFFNILDELDVPGEWYIDRSNCIAYIYPNESLSDSEIELNVSFNESFISINGTDFVSFDGFTFIGSRNGGIRASNVSYVNILNCKFYSMGTTAIDVSGDNVQIRENEMEYIGHGGIVINGGDKATLTRCNITADNNLISHWGLYRRTFTPAVYASGQGITVSHNDIGNSTSNAVIMQGNHNVFEYNLVHDCCTMASDCGAFYNGSSWTSGGIDIRYNAFYNIGTDYEKPAAIYWDDGMAYQRAYGNLIINVSGNGFSIGGGFGHVVTNNVILNTGMSPCLYDGRPYFGNMSGDSFYLIGGFIWNLYKSTPYETPVWRENFPLLSQVLQNNDDKYAPHYGFNPAFSLFSDNIFVNEDATTIGVGIQHVWYSAFIDNYATDQRGLEELFKDHTSGDYRINEDSDALDTARDFEEIPYHLMGRY